MMRGQETGDRRTPAAYCIQAVETGCYLRCWSVASAHLHDSITNRIHQYFKVQKLAFCPILIVLWTMRQSNFGLCPDLLQPVFVRSSSIESVEGGLTDGTRCQPVCSCDAGGPSHTSLCCLFKC